METPLIIQLRINQIKEEFGEHPQCYLMALMLVTYFGGEIYYDHNHCVAQIGEGFYDKDGAVPPEVIEKNNYIRLSKYGIAHEKNLMKALIDKHK